MVADFYELPRTRLSELLNLAQPAWGSPDSKSRPLAMLGTLRRPASRCEEDDFYLSSVLGYLDENHIVDRDPGGECEGISAQLASHHGGAWALLEPRLRTIASVDPRRFDEAVLRAFHERQTVARDPVSGAAMLRDLELVHGALSAISPESVLLIRLH